MIIPGQSHFIVGIALHGWAQVEESKALGTCVHRLLSTYSDSGLAG